MNKELIKFKANILDTLTERMETAGYDDRDTMCIRAVICHEGLNENNALFERDDLEKAVPSLIGKPVRILFEDNNPTGHGYDKLTGKFSNLVKNVGFIHWAYGQENEDGLYEVIVEMIVWQKYCREIATRLRELHREENLYFSIEAERDFETTMEGYRRCYNIHFTGVAVVKNPAFQQVKSLMVAELLKNEGGVQMEEIKNLLQNLSGDVKTEIAEQIKSHVGTLVQDLSDTKEELATAKTDFAELEGTVKELEADRDKYKGIVETAEKEKLGQERHDKLSKYGEVEKTNEELAELSVEEFAEIMIQAVEGYEPSNSQENAENESDISGVAFEKVNAKKVDRKAQLLSLCEGLI